MASDSAGKVKCNHNIIIILIIIIIIWKAQWIMKILSSVRSLPPLPHGQIQCTQLNAGMYVGTDCLINFKML